jgi:hypothetical protein
MIDGSPSSCVRPVSNNRNERGVVPPLEAIRDDAGVHT